jgi:hypothetical protein
MSFNLYYVGGTVVQTGDRVLIYDRVATVTVLIPGTQQAMDYSKPEGGLLVEFDDGDVQAWPRPDEDMEKIIS